MNNNSNKDKKMLTIIVIIVTILVIAQTINNIAQTLKTQDNRKIVSRSSVEYLSVPKGIGSATEHIGIARLCINAPPIIHNDCNLTNAVLDTNITYNCTFNVTDPNGDPITFDTVWLTTPHMFNVTSGGYYNFSPKRIAMNQSNIVRIYAYDNSYCINNYSYREFNMTVVGVNRPPYLVKNIPDEEIVKDKYDLLSLNDYFADPDEDRLSFMAIVTSGNNNIRIRVGANGATELRGLDCGVSTVYFVAIDPPGLTAKSNIVTYTITCPEQTPKPPGDNEKQGGAGNGGGGAQRKCEPNWRCGKWSDCQVGNFSYKRCIDYSACDPHHYEEYLFENCTYIPELHHCVEEWDCNPWSTCKDDIHTRMCIDLKTCGTNITNPDESENCSKIASCFNGVQDGNETGVDCGGPCGACRNLEKPTQTNNLNTIILVIGLLTVGTAGLLTYAFRSKLAAAYKTIFSKKPKIKRRIYINNKQKEKLLLLLNIIQARLDEHKINHAIDESSLFVKEYFKQLLSLDNLTKQELILNIIKLKDKDLEKLLVMFYAKIVTIIHLRNKGVEIREAEIQELIDEMSHEIYLVAEFTDEEAIASVKNRAINTKEMKNIEINNEELLDNIYYKLSNLYIALKFGELLIAKSMYKDIMKDYDKLSNKDKAIPYNDIIRAFHAIYYLETLYKK